MQVRKIGPTLTATRLTADQEVRLADGSLASPASGDWIIGQGKQVLAVVKAAVFPGVYEIIEDQQRILSAADRHALEGTLGIGATDSAASLLAAVQRLARISIGDVPIPFTPGQLEELQHRATKRGRTVAQEIQAVIDRIKDELFWHS